MLLELDIIDTICKELEQKGYIIVSRKKEIRHDGIDIIAKKVKDNGLKEFFYIEVVGETSSDPNSPRFGEPFDSSACKVHVSEQLYSCIELLSRPKIGGATYKIGMAFADNKYYRNHINPIKNALEELNIKVMFINGIKEIDYV